MKIMIIGGGAVSEATHIPTLLKICTPDDIYLAEPNAVQGEKIQSKFNLLHVVSDYKSLINNVDAVIIATPPHLHDEIMAYCIEQKKHVLCEKPISDHIERTKSISEQADPDLVLGTCHTYRQFSNRQYVRQQILDGYFGDKLTIVINEGFPSGWPTVSGYCFRKELVPGGVLFDAGIHSLDFILWCMGMPESIVYADDEMGGLESNAEIRMTFKKGTAVFRISRTCELSNTIVVSGNSRKVELEVFEMNQVLENGEKRIVNPNRLLDWTNVGEMQLRNFVDAINQTAPISCSLSEGIDVVSVIQQCYGQKTSKEMVPEPIGDYKGKKILVTGGTGFIGSLLAERLLIHEQADVRVMVHNWPKAAYVSRFGVELLKADITNYEEVEKAVAGCDYVFHCVGVGGPNAMKINADGTQNVVKACVAHKVKRLVYLSSVVVHGNKIFDGMTADAAFESYGDVYADAKIEAEKRFWQLTKEAKLEASVIRPTYVWGPMSEWYTVEIVRQMKKGSFSWVDQGHGSCNAVYVGNVIDLALVCGIHPKAVGEAFVIRDSEKLEWKDFYGYYANMLHLNSSEFPSIPLTDGIERKLLKYAKYTLSKKINSMWTTILSIEESKPLYTKWGLRAPRKILKVILKKVVAALPEKPASEMAIYNFKGYINIDKSTELLQFQSRFTAEKGMAQTEMWLKEQNFLD